VIPENHLTNRCLNLKFKKLSNLKRFGEMFLVITKKKIKGKLNDKGTVCMFVGYPQNHSDDSYRLFNVKTRQVIKSRGLIWLDKYYESCVPKKQDNQIGFGDPIDNYDSDTTTNILISKETDLKTKLDPSKIKFYNEINRLNSWFNQSIMYH
jgi:hypothetical protein